MTPSPPSAQLKIGVLGAARITPIALLSPARRTPAVQIYAVAARDEGRARHFAARHGIPVVHRSYDDLLADPLIDAVYNPLPNSLHCEWTVRALRAGKHVLCEKPLAANAAQARQMATAAGETGKVLMEAFHYRFHPLATRMKAVLATGTLGPIRHIETELCIPLPLPGDIRYRYDLAGGATMDTGCYAVSLLRFLAGAEPRVVRATAKLSSPKVDRFMTADMEFPDGKGGVAMTGTITCSLWSRCLLSASARVVGERGEMRVFNPFMPSLYHRLDLLVNGKRSHEKVKGETTYTYQLWSFVDSVSKGRPALDPADSIANMEVIDAIYDHAGLPRRGT